MPASKMGFDRVILGIDPGTTIAGYGVIGINGKNPELIALGVIDLRKQKDHYLKLKHIFDRTLGLIDEYKPDDLAVEAPFYGKNVQSMLKLGRAQGASIAAALYRAVPIYEYAPKKIKMSITGQGSASKEQVAGMLKNLLKFKGDDILLDATDGLGAAMCHFFQSQKPSEKSQYGSWKEFMSKNPGRVK